MAPTSERPGSHTLTALRIAIAAALALVATLAAVLVLYERREAWVRHTVEVERMLSDYRSNVQLAETSQRGYLLTLDSSYLAASLGAFAEVDPMGNVERIARKVSDNDSQGSRVEQLRRLTTDKIDELELTKGLAARGRRDEALAIVSSDVGKRYMDRIDSLLREMRDEEAALYARRLSNTEHLFRGALVLMALLGAVLAYSLLRIQRQVGRVFKTLDAERARLAELSDAQATEIRRRERLEVYNGVLVADLQRRNLELEHYAYLVSHELNQPLRTVGAIVQALREDFPDRFADGAGEYAEMIARGAARMQETVDGFLADAQGVERADPLPVDAQAACEEVVDDLAILIEDRGATLTVGELPFVRVDASALRSVLQNLITNAVKYADPARAPRVDIRAAALTPRPADAERSGEPLREVAGYEADAGALSPWWRISVSDNGRGIDAETLERVFGYAERGAAERGDGAAAESGHGLGLATCSRLVRDLGGELTVESRVGEGSTFAFTVPGVVLADGGGGAPITVGPPRGVPAARG